MDRFSSRKTQINWTILLLDLILVISRLYSTDRNVRRPYLQLVVSIGAGGSGISCWPLVAGSIAKLVSI